MDSTTATELLRACGIEAQGDPVAAANQVLAAVDGYRARQGAVVDEHVGAEFDLRDLDRTMRTMNEAPYLVHVPTLTGGEGREAIRSFYGKDFIPCWPPDTTVTPLCRTVGAGVVIDELLMSFTHDREIPIFLPGIKPTGRQVRLPVVVVVGVEDGLVSFERIYWDQASVLAQAGLLDEQRLPAVGARQAAELQRLVDEHASATPR
jgi:carboxymethylenebutenolidase